MAFGEIVRCEKARWRALIELLILDFADARVGGKLPRSWHYSLFALAAARLPSHSKRHLKHAQFDFAIWRLMSLFEVSYETCCKRM